MTVAIIIPTKNRSEFLIRQLAYYAEAGCHHPLFVGDSSEGQHLESTLSAVSKFDNRLEIKHLQLPGLKEHEIIKEIAQQVAEPYVILASGDDFCIPGALEDCAAFLDSHSDYTSAHGLALSFSVGQDRACGEFVRTKEYHQRSAEDANSRLRLLGLLHSYWPARLCVQRTDDFKDLAALASKPLDKDFRELLASCVPIIRGKSKQLDRLYVMRQAHVQYCPRPYAFDWVTDPDWFSSYTLFRSCLEEELVRQDEVGLDEAEEVVKEGFGLYIAKRLAEGRVAPLQSPGPASKRRWLRRAAGAVPGPRQMRRFGKALRTINAPGPDENSLSVLLQPSSAYHRDFMPVYRAVTTPAE